MEDYDGINEREDTKKNMPLGWFIFFIGVIVWGVYYAFINVPIGSWSQYGEYDANNPKPAAPVAAKAATAAAVANPYKGQADEVAEGKKVFTENCVSCHGPDLKGIIGPSLLGPIYKFGGDDAAMFQTVMEGRPGGMPPFKSSLGEKKVWEAISYVDSMKKK